jgi:hypothetical protein
MGLAMWCVSVLGELEQDSSNQLLDQLFRSHCVQQIDGILTRQVTSLFAGVSITREL